MSIVFSEAEAIHTSQARPTTLYHNPERITTGNEPVAPIIVPSSYCQVLYIGGII